MARIASPPEIFDRRLYARRRARAAAFPAHDFLHRRAIEDVIDRLETVTRSFPRALFYGAGSVSALLTPSCGVGEAVAADLVASRLPDGQTAIVYDEERSPFAPESFDLIVSVLTLHAANDIVGALTQMRLTLRPDGLMIAVLFGEETLSELRAALYAAESELAGGISPRIAPFASVRDLGGALQRAQFALPVADLDRVRVRYEAPMRLFDDIRGIGETCCLKDRGQGLRRDTLAAAMARLGATPSITFDMVTLTGWAPDPSQPKPLKPGSATLSLEAAIRHSSSQVHSRS